MAESRDQAIQPADAWTRLPIKEALEFLAASGVRVNRTLEETVDYYQIDGKYPDGIRTWIERHRREIRNELRDSEWAMIRRLREATKGHIGYLDSTTKFLNHWDLGCISVNLMLDVLNLVEGYARDAFFDADEVEAEWLAALPYGEYLKTCHWQNQRDAARERAGGRCQLCNQAENLHVHHRTYERRGCEDPGDLIVLCAACHGKFHDKLPQAEQ